MLYAKVPTHLYIYIYQEVHMTYCTFTLYMVPLLQETCFHETM